MGGMRAPGALTGLGRICITGVASYEDHTRRTPCVGWHDLNVNDVRIGYACHNTIFWQQVFRPMFTSGIEAIVHCFRYVLRFDLMVRWTRSEVCNDI